jgi:hypothetical protein
MKENLIFNELQNQEKDMIKYCIITVFSYDNHKSLVPVIKEYSTAFLVDIVLDEILELV